MLTGYVVAGTIAVVGVIIGGVIWGNTKLGR